MSKPEKHIEKLLLECHKLQEDGHCENNPPAWVKINDIEININELEKLIKEN